MCTEFGGARSRDRKFTSRKSEKRGQSLTCIGTHYFVLKFDLKQF